MQRRDLLLGTAAAVAAAGIPVDWVFGAQPKGATSAEPGSILDSPPVLQNPAPDGVSVVVAVNAASTAWVEYGTSEELGQRADNNRHGLLPFNGRVHHVRIKGLSPGTKYWYRVVACPIDFRGPYKIGRGKPVHSPTYSFTTLDDGKGDAASFAIINDTHETQETMRGLTGLLSREEALPDLLFWNGDLFNDVRSDQQIVEQVMRPAEGAPFAARTPLCFVSGNHDVRGVHARCLDWFLETPGGVRHYVLRQGPVAFIVLDTGEDKSDGHSVYAGLCDFARYRDAQRAWLESALKSEAVRSAAFRVVLQHIPMFGKAASEDSRAKWHALFVSAGVHLVVNGHVHEYKFHPPDAQHSYAQLVGGGPAPGSATLITGRAQGRKMTITARNIAGRVLGEFPFEA